MANFILLGPRASDAATLTADDEATGLPVTSLQTVQPTDVWRTAAAPNPVTLTLDFGASTSIRLVYLGYTNATDAAEWQVRTAPTQGELSSNPTWDTTRISLRNASGLDNIGFTRWPALAYRSAGAVSDRWMDIRIWDSGNPAGYFQAGRLIAGDPANHGFAPPRNMSYGYEPPSLRERTVRDVALSGTEYAGQTGRWREARFDLTLTSETELRDQMMILERQAGGVTPVLFWFDPASLTNAHNQSMLCRLSELTPIVRAGFERWTKRFALREVELP